MLYQLFRTAEVFFVAFVSKNEHKWVEIFRDAVQLSLQESVSDVVHYKNVFMENFLSFLHLIKVQKFIHEPFVGFLPNVVTSPDSEPILEPFLDEQHSCFDFFTFLNLILHVFYPWVSDTYFFVFFNYFYLIPLLGVTFIYRKFNKLNYFLTYHQN